MFEPGNIPEEFLYVVLTMVLLYPLVAMFLKVFEDTSMGLTVEESTDQFGKFYAISGCSFLVNLALVMYFYNTYLNLKTVHIVIQVLLLIFGLILTGIASKFYWAQKN